MAWNRFVLSAILLSTMTATSFGKKIKIDDIYEKKGTWHETIYASLRKLAAMKKAGGESVASFAPIEEQKGIGLSQWRTLPPFKAKGNALKHDYGPEASLDTQHWIVKPKWRGSYVINMSMPGNSVQYCYCQLTAPARKKVKAYLGSDDGIAVILNGKRVFLKDASRGVGANQDSTTLELKKGVNDLLIKIRNGGGGSGMYFSLDEKAKGSIRSSTKGSSVADPLREDLWARVKKDFGREATIVSQMMAEKKDGIWAGKLDGDKYAVLGKRYASKTRPYEGLDKAAKAIQSTDAASLAKLRMIYNKSVKLDEKYGPKDPSAPNNGLPVVLSREENDGILNGPLKSPGLKVKSQGNRESLRLAIENLIHSFKSKYPNGKTYLERLAKINDEKSEEFKQLKKEALLANPLLSFDKLLMVRSKKGSRYARNWQTRASCRGAHDDSLVVMSIRGGTVKTVMKPDGDEFVGDVDLHWGAERLLFTSQAGNDKRKPYHIFELEIDPKTGQAKGPARKVSPDMGSDIDNFYPCYVPSGRIIFASTAAYEGVPCVGGSDFVANLYVMDKNGANVRRLTFDQDASWHPSVQANGRVMYVRWEYTDSAHYFSRLVMTMNPDGADQKAYYGSNSYWPNSMFFPRQIPGRGNSNKFVVTIAGHHSFSKGGPVCIFDVSKGRHEADGAVQFLLGRGKKVAPLVIDNLGGAYDPKFFEPFPLNENYFLAMCNGSIYLVDTFDNMLLIKEADSNGKYYEPIPLQKTKTPPVIPDRIDLKSKEATVLINNIYMGPGLDGVPQGTVKSLRIYRYEYGPRRKGGHYSMGMEAGWDAKQVIGTVPVEADGSAHFKIPANTPVAFQPLDSEGRALQLMRSWTIGMPGENLSCVGCHESQNMPPSRVRATAMLRGPSKTRPFFGKVRGFSFQREVQPVIDKYCVGCHDGAKNLTADGWDKARRYKVPDRIIGTGDNTGKKFAQCGIPDFSNSKSAHRMLHPYVRRNGPEGDYHLLTPLEFHASTSELEQMLRKGHHNVKLDSEAWERLHTWMDLNAPYNGTWTEAGASKQILARRIELRKLYANVSYNPEEIVDPYKKSDDHVMPQKCERIIVAPKPPQVTEKGQGPKSTELDLGDGVKMTLCRIPAGEFSMGSNDETPVEQPVTRVKIAKPFYMGAKEVTLGQFRKFDPKYLNGIYDMHYKDQVKRGYYMNDIRLPVIRVSWVKAMEFCKWLSKKTGKKVSLPTEAQWEWACRAGSTTPMWYGDLDTPFSQYANMADITVKLMAVHGVNPRPIKNPNRTYDFELKDPRSDDNSLLLSVAGSYSPNPWGLYDMHGNAAEWTRSDYKPYPYNPADGRNSGDKTTMKVIRGGSWHDRPFRCSSSFRLGYPTWHRVYHAGFRVIVED